MVVNAPFDQVNYIELKCEVKKNAIQGGELDFGKKHG